MPPATKRNVKKPQRFRTSPDEKPGDGDPSVAVSNEDADDEDKGSVNLLDEDTEEEEEEEEEDEEVVETPQMQAKKPPLTAAQMAAVHSNWDKMMQFAHAPDTDIDDEEEPKKPAAKPSTSKKTPSRSLSIAEKFANLDAAIAAKHPAFADEDDDEDDEEEDEDDDIDDASPRGDSQSSNRSRLSSLSLSTKKRPQKKQAQPSSSVKKTKTKGKNWPPIMSYRPGSKKPECQLFKHKDPRDVAIFTHLSAMERLPSECKGRTTAEWDSFAVTLSNPNVVDNEGGVLFPGGIRGKQLKQRFEQIYKAMKSWMDSAPWRSGHDDEDGDDDPFVACVEDVVQRMRDFEDTEEANRNETNAERKQRSAEAAAMRDAALGEMSAADVKALAAKGKQMAAANGKAAAAASMSSRRSFPELSGFSADTDTEAILRQERLRAKEERRAKLLEAKMELKREELRIRNAEFVATREQSEKMMNVMMEMMKHRNGN